MDEIFYRRSILEAKRREIMEKITSEERVAELEKMFRGFDEMKTKYDDTFNDKGLDQTVCPNCNDDNETLMYEDFLYDRGYTIRICDSCNTKYKVYWNTEVSKVEILSQ